ncbi:MAG TPA: hypothetical protein VL688_08275 [Verrucomicrobiae bacterium]|jgi:hypothetical protein|nr:hypothetical protein [Verrucomicrobiae bacterium]
MAHDAATTPSVPESGSDKFGRKLKESYDYIWKERDDFIRWIALFAVGAMYFSISQLVDNRKTVPPYFSAVMVKCLEASVLGFFVSISAAVVYKWRWSVKYLFDSLELEALQREWEDEESGTVRKAGQLFIDTPAYEKIKKSIKAHVRVTELAYRTALFFFVLAFFPLFYALVLFIK